MPRLVAVLLRMVLVVLLLGALLAQVLLAVEANAVGHEYPEVESLVVPYSTAAIVAVALVQVALCAVWRLLSMVTGDQVFTVQALRWVDIIAACAAGATILSAVVMVHLIFIVQIGGPGVFLGLAACVAWGTALVLLMVVMRGLLRAAISDRSELAEVI